MFLAIPLYDDTPRLRPPVATVGIVALCTLVFLWQLSLGADASDEVAYSLGMVPAVVFGSASLPGSIAVVPPWATLVTSMFLHGGWLHLFGNMLYLWIFGKGVEAALGAPRFLVLYFACGIAAAFTQAVVDPASQVPMIGASGAIAGVLGAYIVLYPRGNVVVFLWIVIIFRLLTVPAAIMLGLWFLLQLISAASASAATPGVAVWAHVGGFLVGIPLVALLRRGGVGMLQPSRTTSFQMIRPGERRNFGRGSVPNSGRRPRDPWP